MIEKKHQNTKSIFKLQSYKFKLNRQRISDHQSTCAFFQSLLKIRYLGKGTYIDCALKAMTNQMVQAPSSSSALRFAVVITDGHVTGNPCGGIKMSAEEARDKGIRVFVVASSSANIEETGLSEIANSPASVFRDDFLAVNLTEGRPVIHNKTMDRIIKTMVTLKRALTDRIQPMACLLMLCFFCLYRNI